jgi:hypothetical protein
MLVMGGKMFAQVAKKKNKPLTRKLEALLKQGASIFFEGVNHCFRNRKKSR